MNFDNIVEITKAINLLQANGYIVEEKPLKGFWRCTQCKLLIKINEAHLCSGKPIDNLNGITYMMKDKIEYNQKEDLSEKKVDLNEKKYDLSEKKYDLSEKKIFIGDPENFLGDQK
jgi:hypothetical protein